MFLITEKNDYKNFVINPFSMFDTCDFVELNKNKVDEIKYFIFNNGKNRFGLIAGIKDGILKCPFSATFGIFSEITKHNKILHYHEAINVLIDWCKINNIKKIIFCTPPLFYNTSHITKFHNALICNNFKILDYDVNFQLNLKKNIKYDCLLSTDARRNLKQAYKNNLKFEKTNNLSDVYKIIKINREEKGFPLWLSEQDIENTSNIIKTDYFLVSNESKYIASAYIQHITDKIVNIVYWGNLQASDKLYPMNYLAEQIYNYYLNNTNIDYISIGTSTLDSIPNFGLCNFKENIGCQCSPKLNFVLDL